MMTYLQSINGYNKSNEPNTSFQDLNPKEFLLLQVPFDSICFYDEFIIPNMCVYIM